MTILDRITWAVALAAALYFAAHVLAAWAR